MGAEPPPSRFARLRAWLAGDWLVRRLRPLVRENHPRRRSSDRLNWRDLVLLVVTVLVLIGGIQQGRIVRDVQETQDRQSEGRRTSQRIVCAATSAVINAGRATISGSTANPHHSEQLERTLRKLGFPPREVRERQARAAARAYARSIALEVQRQAGVTGVVRKDGTLDCVRLARLSRLGPDGTPQPKRVP